MAHRVSTSFLNPYRIFANCKVCSHFKVGLGGSTVAIYYGTSYIKVCFQNNRQAIRQWLSRNDFFLSRMPFVKRQEMDFVIFKGCVQKIPDEHPCYVYIFTGGGGGQGNVPREIFKHEVSKISIQALCAHPFLTDLKHWKLLQKKH